MDEALGQTLMKLGFTDYEARAYLTLLRQAPLSGYAVARQSGVPRSKIYEVLDGLVKRGDVLVSHGDPVQYAPLAPADLVASRRQTLERQLAEAEAGLEEVRARPDDGGLIWDIRGREEIFFRLNEVIGRAEGQILLQIWGEDFAGVRASLAEAAGRGVAVAIVAYGAVDFPPAHIYQHEPGAAEITGEYGGRWAILSIDGREIVAGLVSLGKESRAAWSSHLGIVMPITEQIKHDLYIGEMLARHRAALEADFGPALRDLRRRFGPPPESYRPEREASQRS